MTKEQLVADGKTQRAVIESLIVIGEAANNVMRMAPLLEQRSPAIWQHLRDAYDMRFAAISLTLFRFISPRGAIEPINVRVRFLGRGDHGRIR
jgi:hypothetical protein